MPPLTIHRPNWPAAEPSWGGADLEAFAEPDAWGAASAGGHEFADHGYEDAGAAYGAAKGGDGGYGDGGYDGGAAGGAGGY